MSELGSVAALIMKVSRQLDELNARFAAAEASIQRFGSRLKAEDIAALSVRSGTEFERALSRIKKR